MSASHDEEQALERLLQASRTDPGDAQLRRIEGRFDAWLAESAPARGTETPASARRLARIVPLGAALLLLGVGLFEVASRSDADAPRPERPSNVVAFHVTMATEPSRPARSGTQATTTVQDVSALPARPAVRIVAPAPEATPPRASDVASTPAAAEPTPSIAPATASSVTGSSESSETEVSYLRRTRSTLKSEPARALEMANGHPSRFPHGALDQERELIAIDALVRLGRSDEARARADAFRARYPSSAHLGRVNVLLGGAP